VGVPSLDGVAVKATVVEQGRDRKLRVFKFKRRKHYRRTRGHRQAYTAVRIESIEG
jgi:large subunit ribosomal protein L21